MYSYRFNEFQISGADTLSTVELLNRLILTDNGYDVVIDCLSCWQVKKFSCGNRNSQISGADTLSTVELLNRLILTDNGYDVVIDCLSCWQDIIGANLCLEPVASELLHSEESSVQLASLSLINQLLLNSPNPVAKIRIHHELKGK
uniref:Arm_2 domain-containing protein n=1 Tax=Ascaris lumbricoides TaxID=6252 RepID=A0A0M3IMR9_ASCLU